MCCAIVLQGAGEMTSSSADLCWEDRINAGENSWVWSQTILPFTFNEPDLAASHFFYSDNYNFPSNTERGNSVLSICCIAGVKSAP